MPGEVTGDLLLWLSRLLLLQPALSAEEYIRQLSVLIFWVSVPKLSTKKSEQRMFVLHACRVGIILSSVTRDAVIVVADTTLCCARLREVTALQDLEEVVWLA